MLYFFSQLNCRVSTSVVHRLPKPRRRVRLPYPAPHRSKLCIACSDFYKSEQAHTAVRRFRLREISILTALQKKDICKMSFFCVSAARSVHRSFAQTKQPPPSLAVTFFLRKEQAGCLLPTPGRPHRKEEDTMKRLCLLQGVEYPFHVTKACKNRYGSIKS